MQRKNSIKSYSVYNIDMGTADVYRSNTQMHILISKRVDVSNDTKTLSSILLPTVHFTVLDKMFIVWLFGICWLLKTPTISSEC